MTLLSIVQDAATELKWPVPAAVFGNPAEEAGVLLRLANRVGRDMAARGLWPDRRAMRRITAVAGSAQPGAWPADFARAVPRSLWRTDAPALLLGPLDGAGWAEVTAQPLAGGGPRWWSREGGALLVWPPADGGEALAFEYFSAAFCASAGGTAQQAWQADTDVGLVPEEVLTQGVIAFALRNEGQPWQPMMADYERSLWRASRQAQPPMPLRTEVPASMAPQGWR